MADSSADLHAERLRLHGKRLVARVNEDTLTLDVKDSRITGERQSGVQASTWLKGLSVAQSQAQFP